MKLHPIVAAAAALALAATPAALAKGKPEDPGSQGKGHAKKAKKIVVKGTVVSSTATSLTVLVPAPKGKGKGQAKKPSGELTFDLTGAKLTVADTNGDGAVDGTDLKAADKVVVQGSAADTGYVARHVVDQTNPPADDGEDSDGDDAGEVVVPPVTPTV